VATQSRTSSWAAYVVLAVATLASFTGVLRGGFVFDDSTYIVNNPLVRLGLTPEGLRWSLTTLYAANWHPLTWISHLLDLQLFGLAPAGHHATSLALHTLNALLLLGVLHRMTGSLWRSAFASAFFALHPLRVESVAWVAERKDLLSFLLGLLTIAAYLRYVRRPGGGRYFVVVLVFAAGLLAKPMLVTLPLVLLLLDYWPLGRLEHRTGDVRHALTARLAVEKFPLVALAAVSAAVTILAQWRGGAMTANDATFASRAANASVAIVRYLRMTLWPEGLAVYYPLPISGYPSWMVWSSAGLIAVLFLAALQARRHSPCVFVGVLWFLGTLVPVLGLIQVGNQALADRYTYLPHLGLFVGLTWLAAEVTKRHPALRSIAVAVSLAVFVLLSVATAAQVRFWRDEPALYSRAVAVVPDNWFMNYNLGLLLEGRGQFAEAIQEYEHTLRIRPDHPYAHYNLGRLLLKSGRINEAAEHYLAALSLMPDDADAHCGLAAVLGAQGRTEEAILHLQEALRLQPEHQDARHNLAVFLARRRGG